MKYIFNVIFYILFGAGVGLAVGAYLGHLNQLWILIPAIVAGVALIAAIITTVLIVKAERAIKNAGVSLKRKDIVLQAGEEYTVSKRGKVRPGEYQVMSTDENEKSFNSIIVVLFVATNGYLFMWDINDNDVELLCFFDFFMNVVEKLNDTPKAMCRFCLWTNWYFYFTTFSASFKASSRGFVMPSTKVTSINLPLKLYTLHTKKLSLMRKHHFDSTIFSTSAMSASSRACFGSSLVYPKPSTFLPSCDMPLVRS